MLDKIRYGFALLLLVSLPPGVLFWFIVHPFIGFWRRVGPGWTYVLNLVPAVAVGWAVYLLRVPLLRVDFGFNPWLATLAAVTYLAAVVVELLCRRHLKLSILVGLPELRVGAGPGVMLTEGIYGRVRHPRYFCVFLGTLAFALFVNYLSVYILVLAVLAALRLVIHFEERELLVRFGSAYESYRLRVPMFVPGRSSVDGDS